jgi:hypothetical protein
MLKKVLGNCPQVKVIDFFLSSSNRYFNKSQIAEGSEISRPTLDRFIEDFLEFNILKKSNNGYELNFKSDFVKNLTLANNSLINTQLESEKDKIEVVEYTDEELDDFLDDVFEDEDESKDRITINKNNYIKFKSFYIKNHNLVKFLMEGKKSKNILKTPYRGF